jgi:hypothetical protein
MVDGTAGSPLKLPSEDGYKMTGLPIGTCEISALYRGKSIKLWQTEDEFVHTLQVDFEPQKPAQCDNCQRLEYYYLPSKPFFL